MPKEKECQRGGPPGQQVEID